MEQGGYR